MNSGISKTKQQELQARMKALGIFEEDLEENFIRSGGKGGQNVNKVASCVQIKHLPSGLEVKCQKERAQALNRFYARRLLCEKLDQKINREQSEAQKRLEKIRRQKRKRSKRAQEKVLKFKKITAEKKQQRKSVSPPRDSDNS
jgi:peptide chain release factor